MTTVEASMLAEDKTFVLSKPFVTEKGDSIESAIVTYQEYGKSDGPVVLINHGGLSGPHAAGRYRETDTVTGYWDEIIGPGKSIDTNRYRVISPNALGSMYGTCSALTIDPKTGNHYGPDFPEISMIDMANFTKVFLDEIGVEKLYLAAGPSMGSLHSLQLAALYPDFVEHVVAVATAGRMPPSGMCMHHFMMNTLRMDPEFNKGHYELGKTFASLHIIHQAARIYYSHERILINRFWSRVNEGPDSQAQRSEVCGRYLTVSLEKEISGRDPNCYITILTAVNGFDLGRGANSFAEGIQRIACPVLLINFDSDIEFEPRWAHELADILNQKKPNQAVVKIFESIHGHMACAREGTLIASAISEFLSTR